MPAKHGGEYRLARQLAGLPDDGLHLWFGLNYIPGVKDTDILLWHEDIGVFVIETKAVEIYSVEHFGHERCQIKGRRETESPQLQASNARYDLLNYLPLDARPYISATACWPLIARAEWRSHMVDERIAGEFAERMLFREDCDSGPEALRERLRYIWEHPPVGRGADRHFVHNAGMLDRMNEALHVNAAPVGAPSDLERLRIIEQRVGREAEQDVPVGLPGRIRFHGCPGTGKTFRLLAVGLSHCLAGESVLFCCFNKVLAADAKRLLGLSKLLARVAGRPDVHDVFALLGTHIDAFQLDVDEQDYDKWGQDITAELARRSDEIRKYDVVLIDEAQDMKTWALELAAMHCREGGTLCVADGTGQELYGPPSEWLSRFAAAAETRQLGTNFRNTRPVFQLAHVFYKAALELEGIDKVARSFRKAAMSEGDIPMFERQVGKLPSILEIDDGTVRVDSMWYLDDLWEHMVGEYERLIQGEVDELGEQQRPLDILVLVPSERSEECRWAVKALENLGLDFIDYTRKENRRQIADQDSIRLCTFHSARGLEGDRVVVLGFESVDRVAETTGTPLRNLAYTVLSRALFECTVVRRVKSKERLVMVFLDAALDALRKKPAEKRAGSKR